MLLLLWRKNSGSRRSTSSIMEAKCVVSRLARMGFVPVRGRPDALRRQERSFNTNLWQCEKTGGKKEVSKLGQAAFDGSGSFRWVMLEHIHERCVLATCLGIGVSVCDSPVVVVVAVVKVTQPLQEHCQERDQTHEPQKGKCCRWGMSNGESEH